MTVKRVWQLDAVGQSEKERGRLAREGELVHVRHGAYADRRRQTSWTRTGS